MQPSAKDVVDRFVHSAGRPAFDEDLLVILRGDVAALAKLSPEDLAPHAVRILDAIGNVFRVTGGDAAVDRMNDVLARLDVSRLEAALIERVASLDEQGRRRYVRELEDLAFACPSLIASSRSSRLDRQRPQRTSSRSLASPRSPRR